MYKVCVFSTEYSYRWIKEIYNLNLEEIEIRIIKYNNLSNLEELFKEHYQFYDGVIFSGQIPYLHIRKTLPEEFSALPVLFTDITERDFYFKLAEIQYLHPDFNFKDAIIDFIYKENNYLGLKEWLRPEDFPYSFTDTIQLFGEPNVYELVSKCHLKLIEEKKVKYCFTRLTNLYTYFKDIDLTPILVVPTEKSIESTVQKLVKEMELVNLKNSQVVCGHIQFSVPENDLLEIEYRQIALYKAILDFNREFGFSLITYRSAIHYEIITNYSDYIKITNNETKCSLASFLRSQLPFKVRIGWGIGKTLANAQIQAEKASAYGKDNITESYSLNKEDHLIGPLEGETFLKTPETVITRLEEISFVTHISLFHLQKIHSMIITLKTNTFTAEEISSHLSITVRSTNRILKKLEEHAFAKIQKAPLKHHSKGRPKNVYLLNFD